MPCLEISSLTLYRLVEQDPWIYTTDSYTWLLHVLSSLPLPAAEEKALPTRTADVAVRPASRRIEYAILCHSN